MQLRGAAHRLRPTLRHLARLRRVSHAPAQPTPPHPPVDPLVSIWGVERAGEFSRLGPLAGCFWSCVLVLPADSRLCLSIGTRPRFCRVKRRRRSSSGSWRVHCSAKRAIFFVCKHSALCPLSSPTPRRLRTCEYNTSGLDKIRSLSAVKGKNHRVSKLQSQREGPPVLQNAPSASNRSRVK